MATTQVLPVPRRQYDNDQDGKKDDESGSVTGSHLYCGCGRRTPSTPNAHRTANARTNSGFRGIYKVYDAAASFDASEKFRRRMETSLIWKVQMHHYSEPPLIATPTARRDHMLNIDMVARAVFAQQQFSLPRLLQRKFIKWVRKAPSDLTRRLLYNIECRGARLDVPLERTSLLHAQRRLRARLTAKLRTGTDEAAFAQLCGVNLRPRADDLEGMYAAFPGWDDVDWDATHVTSGLDLKFWKEGHARHCRHGCTAETLHDDCYFRLLYHFLDTGFEPPLLPGESLSDSASPTRAYVDLWNKNARACREAYQKWLQCDIDFLSPCTRTPPTATCPLLPVVKRKHIWRFQRTGVPAPARLCLDLLTAGQNAKVKDWKFRYWTFESVPERVQKGDWLVVLDISTYFLRLPAGKRMRMAQFFQDPSSFGPDSKSNDNLPPDALKWRHLLTVAFGWKVAPAFASTVSAELVRILRTYKVDVAGIYLDDLLIRAPSRRAAKRMLKTALRIMKRLGLPANAKIQGPCAPWEGAVYLGILVRTDDCTLRITEEHRRYVIDRLQDILREKQTTVNDLQSLAGILTWLSAVMIQGRPRRWAIYAACSGTKTSVVRIRGHLSSQLHWWHAELKSNRWKGVRFWTSSPMMPLVLSDASGEDGWGVCAMGLHIYGVWPKEIRGNDAESMLFKEALPPVVAAMILAPVLRGKLLCCALDNAGAAYVLNALSCHAESCRPLLTALTDSLVRFGYGLLADHARRHRNAHADALPRAISPSTWDHLTKQVTTKTNKTWFHFVVLDTVTGDCRCAAMAFTGLHKNANAPTTNTTMTRRHGGFRRRRRTTQAHQA